MGSCLQAVGGPPQAPWKQSPVLLDREACLKLRAGPEIRGFPGTWPSQTFPDSEPQHSPVAPPGRCSGRKRDSSSLSNSGFTLLLLWNPPTPPPQALFRAWTWCRRSARPEEASLLVQPFPGPIEQNGCVFVCTCECAQAFTYRTNISEHQLCARHRYRHGGNSKQQTKPAGALPSGGRCSR